MNPAIADGRAAERVRSTERSGSVERLRLHGDGFPAHGDRPPSRHVPLHFVQMAFRVSESPTLFSGADRFDNHWILLWFKEPKRVSYALARFGPTHRSIEHAIGRVGRSDRSAQGFVQPNGHHYLRTGIYLNGYRVAAMLRPNTWECELTPEAVRLRRNGVNIMTVYITFCRGRLKPPPRTRFTFSSVALGTNRPRFVHWLNRRMNSVRKMSATRVSPWNTSMFSSFVVNSYRT